MAGPLEVVVRCKNEFPHVVRTLDALARPDYRVIVIDSGSTDGSLEVAQKAGVEIVRIAPASYVPGKVLNDAMKRTTGDVVAFVNADAVPLTSDAPWLLAARCYAGASATYGRQLPRASARGLTVHDHSRAFPEGKHDGKLGSFFSMAASAIRRDVWEALPFDEDLRYSEDVDWTTRLRALGLDVEYLPQAVFEHSHDYDAAAMERRMLGEGQADAIIQRRRAPNPWGDFVRPLAGALLRDARAGFVSRESLELRWAAQRGRFRGLRQGVSTRRRSAPERDLVPNRYTLSGDASDELVIHAHLERTADIAERKLGGRMKGLLLLGSYGCGEGAVGSRDGQRAVALSDLDLVLIVDSAQEARALRHVCAEISREASSSEGVAIDVWPVSQHELFAPAGRLLWVDAGVRGARLVRGAPELLEPLRQLSARSVPNEEWARLLANRATGLALSRLAQERGEHDPRVALHHVAKAWIALGDALLIRVDRYHGASSERRAQLERLERVGARRCRGLAERYAWALAQRAQRRPAELSGSELLEQLPSIWAVQCELEAERLRTRGFSSPLAYATQPASLYSALPDVPFVARKLAGLRAAAHRVVAWRSWRIHPRELLARASVALAFDDDRQKALGWFSDQVGPEVDGPTSAQRALVALREVGA